MPNRAPADCPSWYRFSGAFVASCLAGVKVGDEFHGTFRYDPGAVPVEVTPPESRYADPAGHLDATVGDCPVPSAGALEIRLFSTQSVSRVALAAMPTGPAATHIHTCHVTLLTACPIESGAALAAALDADAFDTRSFTIEDASYTGFAIGTIRSLARIDRRAAPTAPSVHGPLTGLP